MPLPLDTLKWKEPAIKQSFVSGRIPIKRCRMRTQWSHRCRFRFGAGGTTTSERASDGDVESVAIDRPVATTSKTLRSISELLFSTSVVITAAIPAEAIQTIWQDRQLSLWESVDVII